MYSSPGPSRVASPRPELNTGLSAMDLDLHNQSRPNTRPMQVKILYTFDDDSKTNCLARCPQPISVQTAHLDPATEVGIIELRTCIQAIVTASPELLAKLGKDYTVYAYDYSEYETPLVGQGMLSWVLASASSTPNAPAEESKTMVTGRVNRSTGLFSGAAKETLEVKLRLVPVPTSLQNEYVASMEKFRDSSNIIDHGEFDAAAWTDFLIQNPGFGDNAPSPVVQPTGCTMPGHAQIPNEPSSHDLHASSWIDTPSAASAAGAHGSATRYSIPADNSNFLSESENRAGTDRPQYANYQNSRSGTPSQQTANGSQPASRLPSRAGSVGQIPEQVYSHRQSISAMTPPGDPDPDYLFHSTQGNSTLQEAEEGSSRKRIRTERAAWHGPSPFSSNNEPLRVAASAAASMRGHRLSTTAAELSASDPLNRPPTPRPRSAQALRKPTRLSRSTSSLAQESLTIKHSPPFIASYGTNDLPSVMSSPEKQESVASTPQDIPSSPPVLTRPSPTPSSPLLPQNPSSMRFQDSGFASGGFDDYYDEDAYKDNDDEPRSVSGAAKADQKPKRPVAKPAKKAALAIAKRPISELSIMEETPGDPSLLPRTRRILPGPPPPPRPPPTATQRQHSAPGRLDSSPRLPARLPTNVSELIFDHLPPASSEIGPEAPLRGLIRNLSHDPSFTSEAGDLPSEYNGAYPDACYVGEESFRGRSVSFAAEDASQADSPAPGDEGNVVGKSADGTLTNRKNGYGSGSSMKRKRAIERQLASCLNEGRIPPFCKNCGSIQTPTWRKAFMRVYEGDMKDFQIPEDEGGTTTWEPMTRDDAGNMTSYRVVKKSLSDNDEEFEEIELCNPCGIWFFKFKSMRPPDKWNPQPKDPNPKPRKRPSRRKNPLNLAGAAHTQSEPVQQPPQSDAMEPDAGEHDSNSSSSQQRSSHPMADTLSKVTKALTYNPPRQFKRSNSMNDFGGLPPHTGNWDAQLVGKKGVAAAAALERAIQSSPPRFPGSKFSPIEIDGELTPKPTRRALFPSPRKAGEIKSLESPNLDGSPSKIRNMDRKESGSDGASDKENEPVKRSDDNTGNDVSNFPGGSPLAKRTATTPSRTPKSGSLTRSLLQTPSSSAKRRILTPRGLFSSASRRFRDNNASNLLLETPSARQLMLSEDLDAAGVSLSPFTAHLSRLIKEATYQPSSSPIRTGHQRDDAGMDRPGSGGGDDRGLFAFSDFSADEMHGLLDMQDMGNLLSSDAHPFLSTYTDGVALDHQHKNMGETSHHRAGSDAGHHDDGQASIQEADIDAIMDEVSATSAAGTGTGAASSPAAAVVATT